MKFEIETNLDDFTKVQKQMLVDIFMKRVTKAYIDSLELTDEQKNQLIKERRVSDEAEEKNMYICKEECSS